jgi:ABC-type phosphate/phosphonate transport system substrate-binding protein
MIASLGMYDRPETAAANDRFWALIRDNLRAKAMPAPDRLTRGTGAYWEAWHAENLVLSQTCGFPYRAVLHDKVTLIGTPDYGVSDCPAGYYCSVLVARAADYRPDVAAFADARFAYNEALSQSGWAAPQNHAASLGFHFQPTLQTGGHLFSARAVAQSHADIAAIDAVTWAMLQRWEPFAKTLREVARTPPTPGLPYIAGRKANGVTLFDAVQDSINQLAPDDRACLMLKSLIHIAPAAYLAVAIPPTPEMIA